jgi:small conductance mechanosensitive channel
MFMNCTRLNRWIGVALVACVVACVFASPRLVRGQEDSGTDAAETTAPEDTPEQSDYESTTTADPTIPVDQLKILVTPLTKSELEVEATAWMDLLRAKARQIAAARLGVKKTNEAITADSGSEAQAEIEDFAAVKEQVNLEAETAQGEQAENAQQPDAAAGTREDPQPTSSEAAEGSDLADVAAGKKDELLGAVNALQEERTALVDRLEAVLVSLEAKGGDVEEYRTYAAAVSGIQLDATDASATWAAIRGWFTSKEGGQRWAWNILRFLLILLITYIAAKVVAAVVNWLLERKLKLSQLAENLISKTIKNVIMIVGFVIALTALEIDVTPILAAIGATGFIVGFALQGTLSNFASGLMILINRPFDEGDAVNAGGVTGTIREMNLVSTTFRTFDNQTIHVPNNSIWGSVITNITANDNRRVDMQFGIGYDDNFEDAERIIREVVEEHELVLKDPEPAVVMHELADSCLNILCRPWAKTGDYWTVKTDVTRRVKQRFDQAGISIPYPQRDVHVYQHAAGTPD